MGMRSTRHPFDPPPECARRGSTCARLGMAIGWLCSRFVRRVYDDTLALAKAEWHEKALKRAAAMRAVLKPLPDEPTPEFEVFWR